jgi:hypothetical protein
MAKFAVQISNGYIDWNQSSRAYATLAEKTRLGCLKSMKIATRHADAWNKRAKMGNQSDFINGVSVELTEQDCRDMAGIWELIGLNMLTLNNKELSETQPRWP